MRTMCVAAMIPPVYHDSDVHHLKCHSPFWRTTKRKGESMATMRVAQVSRPNGPFEIVERPVPEPGAGEVRIRVRACGICHSDSLTKEGLSPGLRFPRVPGHEVAGVVDKAGPGAQGWEP